MSLLHAHFHSRNQQAFKRLLDSSSHGSSTGPGSASGGKSWNRPSPLASDLNVNARDALGRTVLHLASASTAPSAPEYVRMLLAHPHINANLQDLESHWTALHHALYHGNIATALLLLQRADIDPNLKDLEGYRPFDLYNSSVEHTKPENGHGILYTWGTNRNASLGTGDPDDRTFPDQVMLERPATSAADSLDTRFQPVFVEKVAMAKLHTGVITDEPRHNLRLCGFGSGGRLGPGNHTQYALQMVSLPASTAAPSGYKPSTLPGNPQRIIDIALGQDHTLALTASGEVLSWGLNRFSQLGYVVEGTSSPLSGIKEEIQSTPRKVPGLKNRSILGVAACKTASVCWAGAEVWTWGTNGGQLGYDSNAHPVQVSPRIVTKITQPVLSISITDSAMACLLGSHDVVCLCNDIYFKINFPTQAFPSEITTYRPPQAIRNASIQKITSCENTFAALSTNGELFTFSLPTTGGGAVKPQRVWALRKQFSAVIDVALGVDGTIIICTESGHVFIRSRTFKVSSSSSLSSFSPSAASVTTSGGSGGGSNKQFKFQRVPYIQRVRTVCANSAGAFGAITLETGAEDVRVEGSVIQESLAGIRPYRVWREGVLEDVGGESESEEGGVIRMEVDAEEMDEDAGISKDVREIGKLCRLLVQDKLARKDGTTSFDWNRLPFGADLVIQTGSGVDFPAHKVVIAARSSVLSSILARKMTAQSKEWHISIKLTSSPPSSRQKVSHDDLVQPPWAYQSKLAISGVHPLSVLILLEYLYTDEVLAVWDPRISRLIHDRLASVRTKAAQIKIDLQRLADLLDLPLLSKALDAPVKRSPQPSMSSNFLQLLSCVQSNMQNIATGHLPPARPDVVLIFADHEVFCHSAVLRARSELFAAFFDDESWTRRRWSEEGVVRMDLGHMRWKAAGYVVRFLYGDDERMFDLLEIVDTVDELLDFMFEVMACANELLLDRLFLICAAVIIRRVNITNACAVLIEATYYHATPLIRSIQHYIAINLETFLESHLLDDLPIDILRQLSAFIREQQALRSPISRSGVLTSTAMEKHKEWLAMEDFPTPIAKTSAHPSRVIHSARVSPPGPLRKNKSLTSPSASPALRPQISPLTPQAGNGNAGPDDDEVFIMDETVPSLNLNQNGAGAARAEVQDAPGGRPAASWKVAAPPKVDMKAIMAEAATSRLVSSRTSSSSNLRQGIPVGSSDVPNWRTPQQTNRQLPDTPERPSPIRSASGSPWKVSSISNPVTPGPTARTAPATPQAQTPRPREEPAPTTPSKPPSGGPSTPPRIHGLGPVFTPSKQSQSKAGPSSGARRVSGGSAWTLPPVQPTVQPVPSASTTMSFAAIQLAQLEQESVPIKDKRSLKEIQEEEQARQVEEDFLRWWAAEEERVRLEGQAALATLAPPTNAAQKKGKKGMPKGTSGSKPQPQSQTRASEQESLRRQEAGGDGGRKRHRRPPGQGKKEVKAGISRQAAAPRA